MDTPAPATLRRLGCVPYEPTWRAMREFTDRRDGATPDEFWLVEHPPVYTVGLAGRPQHLPAEGGPIPIVRVDRGGQVTYHGPGQPIVYVLLDLRRLGVGVRTVVRTLEQAVLDLLARYGARGERRDGAPGVYLEGAKIAALGLRVRNGCCYHGVALNADMDLSPFAEIDPCGYPGLRVTCARDCGIRAGAAELGEALLGTVAAALAPGAIRSEVTS